MLEEKKGNKSVGRTEVDNQKSRCWQKRKGCKKMTLIWLLLTSPMTLPKLLYSKKISTKNCSIGTAVQSTEPVCKAQKQNWMKMFSKLECLAKKKCSSDWRCPIKDWLSWASWTIEKAGRKKNTKQGRWSLTDLLSLSTAIPKWRNKKQLHPNLAINADLQFARQELLFLSNICLVSPYLFAKKRKTTTCFSFR